MRIALFGQATFGKDVFDALQAVGEEIVGVSTPRPGERPDPLFVAAQESGLPLILTRDLRREEHFEAYRAWQPDLLVFAFVTDIVRKNVLDAASHGAIQYHPSLLPRHRGRSAMAWPLIEGETKTGVTIFWVDEGIDTGPVLLQREVEIGEQDSVGSLYFERLYPMGVEMLSEATAMVRDGTAPRIAQDESQATYEPPLGPEHGAVDWSRPGPVIFNHIRGCDPQPGAVALLNGAPVGLFDATYAGGAPHEPPGAVTAERDGKIDVAVIGGTLTVGRLQAQGARKVAAAELASTGDVLQRLPESLPESTA